MGLNIDVFQEPRGVMRLLQFIFAIWAFAETVNFTNEINLTYCTSDHASLKFSYPYQLDRINTTLHSCTNDTTLTTFSLVGDFSSDAHFFVATGVLSMLYCLGISVVYVLFFELYESNATVPKFDFIATLLLAVFWLSGSGAWANGVVGLKSVTDPKAIKLWKSCKDLNCFAKIGTYSGLNISLTLGFLNFFLWAFDIWFIYKETQWFKDAGKTSVPSNSGVSPA